MTRTLNNVIFGLAFLSVGFSAHAQSPAPDVEQAALRESTLSASKTARVMAAGGDWAGSISTLENAINNLSTSNRSTAAYRSYLYFNLGYLYEQWPDADVNSLRMAQQSYVQALENKPNDAKILNNLILVSKAIGDNESALGYIDQMVRLDSSSAYQWHLVAGDIYRAEGRSDQAWTSYKKAVVLNPTNRSAAQKIVDLYEMNPVDGERLLAQCKEFRKSGMAEMARLGLEEIIRNHCASWSSDPQYMEDAILEWVGVLIENHWVRPDVLAGTSEINCTTTALADLEMGIKEGWSVIPTDSWWRENDRRKFYYLAAQKGWADYLFSTGKLGEAMVLYEGIWAPLASMPDRSAEIYERDGVILTDLLTQLARLYTNKTLDPNGRKFRELEMRLFQQKGGAIASGDLPEMQKFHTILGYIYVERQVWDNGPMGAKYQLEHAIRAAKRAVQNDPTLYKPIPHLYHYLGIAYSNTRRTNEAADAYLDAAIDYLETDNLGLVEQMIGEADKLRSTTPATRAKALSAKTLLEARTQIKQLGQEAFVSDSDQYYRNQARYRWLDNTSGLEGIPEDVLERQRFKTLSDLSEQADALGATSASLNLKDQARTQLTDVRILSSQQDVIRVKKIDNVSQLTDYKQIGNQPDQKADPRQEIYVPTQQPKVKKAIYMKQQ